jgi:primosomal protein N' (replication factor Y)
MSAPRPVRGPQPAVQALLPLPADAGAGPPREADAGSGAPVLAPGDVLVEVAVPLPVDGTFTYAAPRSMGLHVGHAVLVPFGARKVSAYVVGPGSLPPGARHKVRQVERLLDPEPVFDARQLELCRWAADYYLAGLGEALATALPGSYKGTSKRVFRATAQGIDALGREQVPEPDRLAVLREVVAHPGRSRGGLDRALHGELDPELIGRALDALVRLGHVEDEQVEPQAPGHLVKVVRLKVDPANALVTLGSRMRSVLAALQDAGGELPLRALLELEGQSAAASVDRLVEKGLVEKLEREDRGAAAATEELGGQGGAAPAPNAAQQTALDAIAAAGSRPLLLHGVTGSGKTEVYLQAAARVLAEGKQVLVLVPEIALTPQLLARFRGRFGGAVAVLHSGLSAGDRLREWRRIRAGEAQVAVGARSALFAPFTDLGLILVDEEHDDSYKQDDGVRYHARDLAVVRARMAGCPVVLGSATPSLETWFNAHEGRYALVKMPKRATPRAVPRIEIVDMRGLPGDALISPALEDALRTTADRGGKAIVLFNRRGFAPVVECSGCGAEFTCPSCCISLVLHRRQQRLSCHHCGFFVPYQPDCGICGTALSEVGHGTERVEEVLAERFPTLRLSRMDADTTRARGAHGRILEGFRRGDADLLVGTQLVAKGHDFPDVHLAAVVGVDSLLSLPDLRSAERTWALVTQLAGRAGRGEVPGTVLVQTRHPEHFVFRQLDQGDEDGVTEDDLDAFYLKELHHRRALAYPPVARLVMLRVEGADRELTFARAQALAAALRSPGGEPQVLGPVPAPMSKLVGRWRFQLILRARRDPAALRRLLRAHRGALIEGSKGGVRLIVDVDPRNLL